MWLKVDRVRVKRRGVW
jgi:hypothetical protein